MLSYASNSLLLLAVSFSSSIIHSHLTKNQSLLSQFLFFLLSTHPLRRTEVPLNLTFCRFDQRFRDTVWHFRRVTVFQTPKTSLRLHPLSCHYMTDKWILNCPSRHSNRTFHQNDILFLRIQITLLVTEIRIALPCRDKSCCRLDCICS